MNNLYLVCNVYTVVEIDEESIDSNLHLAEIEP